MPKFSVKKPYTVVVGIVIVLILGFVSFTKLSTDLLPSMNFPYAIVMTTYQGASPEQVEMIVTEPVEASMATVSNIKQISSTSSENYSLVILEFNTAANMDSVTIEMRESLDMISAYWPDEVGTPIILKLNPDMMPVMMAALSGEGMTPEEVSSLYEEKISSDLKRIDGVASVTASGLIESSVQVVLDEKRIDELNKKLGSRFMYLVHKFFELGEHFRVLPKPFSPEGIAQRGDSGDYKTDVIVCTFDKKLSGLLIEMTSAKLEPAKKGGSAHRTHYNSVFYLDIADFPRSKQRFVFFVNVLHIESSFRLLHSILHCFIECVK